MPIHDIIVHLFLGKYVEPLPLRTWVSIVRILRYQQCLARLGWIMRKNDQLDKLPEYVVNHVKNAELIAQKQYNQVQYEVKILHRLLKPMSTHLLFLKGAAYSVTDNANVGFGRTYSDIDLLVDKKSIQNIEKELCLYGFFSEDLDEYDQKYYREWTHEIPPMRHGSRGTVLDVHHNLLPPITGRAPDVELFFQHTHKTSNGYTVFSPAAMLLHSSIHLFLNEEIKHGFRDLTDLYLIIEQYQDENFWQEVVSLAIKSGFATEIFLALRYNKIILSLEIPETVSNQLKVYRPNNYQLRFLDFVFLNKLRATHPVNPSKNYLLADWLLLIRGHFLKMPFLLLLKHLSRKILRQILSSIFGSSMFDKKTEQPQKNSPSTHTKASEK